jgi:hypothetical protein
VDGAAAHVVRHVPLLCRQWLDSTLVCPECGKLSRQMALIPFHEDSNSRTAFGVGAVQASVTCPFKTNPQRCLMTKLASSPTY